MEVYEFAQKVTKALSDYYGEGTEVKTHKIYKNNGVQFYGICVLEKDRNIAPTVYVNEFFARYQKGETFANVMREIIQILEQNRVEESIDVEFFTNYENVRKKLVLRLIHEEKNRELLKEVPHQKFMDLAVVCHCIMTNEEIGYGAILIHKQHLEVWGIDEETLLRDAFENSPKIEPGSILKMSEMIKEILRGSVKEQIDKISDIREERKDELLDITLENMAREVEEIPMYVLTNGRKYYGAACLVYPDMLKRISEKLQGDFYVLPSSVHEIILMKKTDALEEASLNQMIEEVNQTQVTKEEWLSNHAYLYQSNSGKLISVTNRL